MNSENTGNHESHRNVATEGFMSENEILEAFTKFRSDLKYDNKSKNSPPDIKKWIDGKNHHPKVFKHTDELKQWSAKSTRKDRLFGPPDPNSGKPYNCDTLSLEWMRWYFSLDEKSNPHTNPGDRYGIDNSFLMNKNNTLAYFVNTAPFQEPHDFKTVTITQEDVPLMFPNYTYHASYQDHPSIHTDEDLTELVLKDLSGIKTLQVTLDDEPIHGCCVVMNKSRKVSIAAQDNVVKIPENRLNRPNPEIQMVFGLMATLIKPKYLDPGDHLLHSIAISKNYFMKSLISISVLT